MLCLTHLKTSSYVSYHLIGFHCARTRNLQFFSPVSSLLHDNDEHALLNTVLFIIYFSIISQLISTLDSRGYFLAMKRATKEGGIGIGIGIGLLKIHIATSKAELHEITV